MRMLDAAYTLFPDPFRALVASIGLVLLLAVASACAGGDDDDDDSSDNDSDAAADIWRPAPGTTWQWQLSGAIDESFDVEMYDIDLFDVPGQMMQALRDSGRVVICYFSAGSLEDWREDASQFPEEALGNNLDGWEGERWLDVTNAAVREIMLARLDVAVVKGCDGVEPDNVDGYDNDNGLGLTESDQIDYNRFLADAAHARGLSIGLKNDMGQIDDLRDDFDWALNEECHAYDECGAYADFLAAGKAVFNAEYVDDWPDAPALAEDICGTFPDLSTIVKEWDLTARRLSCDAV
ncbi:MAG: endo alpha-1,4 polygalactosaminidase [Deltaproteobacteria bacterium]|nr:endo alpha-1,4 polygalactosaminidase [Deltaproteobacteria bacterium]